MVLIPVGIANINWYGVAKGEDRIYMQKYSIIKGPINSHESFLINDHYLDLMDPSLAETMRWFSKGFYTAEKLNEKIRIYNLQVDMRGIIDIGDIKAPTKGFFEISIDGKNNSFSSGSHK